jgi:glycosyltransferase involved in cell wall biosynthesis
LERDFDVTVISTFPFERGSFPSEARCKTIALPFSDYAGSNLVSSPRASDVNLRSVVRFVMTKAVRRLGVNLSAVWNAHVAPVGAILRSRKLVETLQTIQPDIVHALRIPVEGQLSALARPKRLIISVWGNDFTLKATRHVLHRYLTRVALQRTTWLIPDCHRDAYLAQEFGLPVSTPVTVLPASGGIDTSVFRPDRPTDEERRALDIPMHAPVVFNPRGEREYVRNDVFFRSVPLVLEEFPDAIFLAGAMVHSESATRLVSKLGIDRSVRLLPYVPESQLAKYFALSDLSVSPSTHDGTPITLLEAMACGAVPVVSDLESVREWVEHQQNGLVFDVHSEHDLANKIVAALRDRDFMRRAQESNLKIIRRQATRSVVGAKAEELYESVMNR